jgi:hypothetical protein
MMTREFQCRRFFSTLSLARKLRNRTRPERQLMLTIYRLGFTEGWGVV